MHQLTNSQRTADRVLAGLPQKTTLEAYLADRWARGFKYEAISKDLYEVTGGVISVSYTTVKRWLNDFGLKEAS